MRTPLPRAPVRVNQIRAFLLERGIAVQQGLRFLRTELPQILPKRADVLGAHDRGSGGRLAPARIQGLSGEFEIMATAAKRRLHPNVLANRLARIAWTALSNDCDFTTATSAQRIAAFSDRCAHT